MLRNGTTNASRQQPDNFTTVAADRTRMKSLRRILHGDPRRCKRLIFVASTTKYSILRTSLSTSTTVNKRVEPRAWVERPTGQHPSTTDMKSLSILIILVSVAESFSPSATTSSTATSASSTVLALATSINTRHRIENQELGIYEQQTTCRDTTTGKYYPCNAISGHERRASFTSYAPPHGSPPTYGAVGCPGGGDWCYSSSFAAAGALPPSVEAQKRAATVAAALAGLGKGTGGARELGSVSIPKLSSSSTSMAGLMLASFDSRLASSTTGGGGGGGSSVMGEDVRESRASYAPFDHYGRVGIVGEIGDEKSVHRPAPMARMAGALPPSYSSSPPKKSMVSKSTSGKPKKYGLGSWKK